MTEEQIEEEERRTQISSYIRLLVRDFGSAEVVDRIRFATFETGGDEYKAEALALVQQWAETWADHRAGLILVGPVGTGKDHLAFSAVRQVVFQNCVSARMVNGLDLAGDCRDAMKSGEAERELLGDLVSPEVLILSDPTPPIGQLTAYQAGVIYRIADRRARRGVCSVLTLNVASNEEADQKLGAATWDRFNDGAWLVQCDWETHRKPSRVLTKNRREGVQ